MELKPNDIQEILRIFAESELEELQLDVAGTRLHVSKSASGLSLPNPGPASVPASAGVSSSTPSSAAPQPSAADEPAPTHAVPAAAGEVQTPVAAAEESPAPPSDPPPGAERDGLYELRSPLLGVFYRRPSPDQPPFVEVGSEVTADDPVCIVDVMKMFTRVPAGVSGRVAEICVEDAQLVEHGQLLMRIEPT